MVLGGLIPVVAGLGTSFLPTSHAASEAAGTWAYPMTVQVFAALAAALTIAHLLVAAGYDAIGDRSNGGSARSFVQLAALGSLLAGACEVASGILAKAQDDGQLIARLNAGYAVSTALILLGTLGAGLALRRAWRRVGVALLINGTFILVAVVPAFAWSMLHEDDGPRIATLTVWSLLYVWVGLASRRGPSAQSFGALGQ